jgi:hypothetical protein
MSVVHDAARMRRAIAKLLQSNAMAHDLWCKCSAAVKKEHSTESVPQLQSLACRAFMGELQSSANQALTNEVRAAA